MKKLFFCLILFAGYANAAPLTDQEKIEFIKSSVPSCVSKNIVAQKITSADDKKLIQKYCTCQATVMTAISTREEMKEVVAGRVPKTFANNVKRAQDECIRNM